ncbi:MAG: UDP-2,4-diacetamido-2,4,6-trideoxy-beta-L-altropyranose hydrolase [Chloroflexi bacterium]|nr:UDP-2,4-diacetamido-2,4,6-trideoxy-beta-L-altropyranose hydrolase [Chloroflexota bacterium]|tara:strand:+ start:927 stop:1973 length:1047 start_codon:yes stop_codon:yes gene_type:complete
MKDTIFIRVESGEDVGYGHIIRCMALANYLKIHFKIIFITSNSTGNLNSLIKKNNFRRISLMRLIPLSHSNIINDAQQTIKIIKKFGNEKSLLLVDSYNLPIRWESLVKPYVRKLIVIDDLISRKHNCDLIIDQNLHTDMKKLYQNLIPNSCVKLFGPDYAILRKQFFIQRKHMKVRSLPIQKILISFGGSDKKDYTLSILNLIECLEKIKKIYVVVGSASSNKDKIRYFCKNHSQFEYIEQTENMAKLMRNADLAIGSGGTTTWERCCLGLPSIIFVTSIDQKDIANAVSRYNCGINLGKLNKSSKLVLSKILSSFNKKEFEIMSKNCMNLVDGKGAIRITNVIRKL